MFRSQNKPHDIRRHEHSETLNKNGQRTSATQRISPGEALVQLAWILEFLA